MTPDPTPDSLSPRPSLLPSLAVIEARLIFNAMERKTLNTLFKLAVAEAKANGTYADYIGDDGGASANVTHPTPLFPDPEPKPEPESKSEPETSPEPKSRPDVVPTQKRGVQYT